MATLHFNKAAQRFPFEVHRAGKLIAAYANWGMALCRVQYENTGV